MTINPQAVVVQVEGEDYVLAFRHTHIRGRPLNHLQDPVFAESFVQRLLAEGHRSITLTIFMRELSFTHGLSGNESELLCWALTNGVLQVYRGHDVVEEQLPTLVVPIRRSNPEPEAEESIADTFMSTLTVVDDENDKPVADVELILTFADGSEHVCKTDSDGRIEIESPCKGSYSIRCDSAGVTAEEALTYRMMGGLSPNFDPETQERDAVNGTTIVELEAHEVRSGESLESIAADAEITANTLAQFNWGTTDAEAIQSFLFLDVGCTVVDEASGNLILDDSDDPGIIWVPKSFCKKGLALDRLEIVRVAKMPPPERPLFST